MHHVSSETEDLATRVIDFALSRLKTVPDLHPTVPAARLDRLGGGTISAAGLGPQRAMDIFTDVVAAHSTATDHPAYLAYVPTAPTPAAILFDLAVSASGIIGSGWVDGGGAIWAENQALRWLADLAGLGPDAGGCFVSGASAGNLSALAVARSKAQKTRRRNSGRWNIIASEDTHSSVTTAAKILDIDIIRAPLDGHGRLTKAAVTATLRRVDPKSVFAIVATAGTTNAGAVDDLAGLADLCDAHSIWMHIDAAYGGAGLCAPSVKHRFEGIERAQSLVVDPHKFLFAPYDCCALLYADPSHAARLFCQEADYLDGAHKVTEWNPMDYAFHLTRRPRGLPFWFSLATHGTDAYSAAVEHVLQLTRDLAAIIRKTAGLDLIAEPELSTLLIRRQNWRMRDYELWSEKLMRERRAFVQPTLWQGEPVMRLCLVNPQTRPDMLAALIDDLACFAPEPECVAAG
jgi:glutamate/tyrosine decarboxylase-like PLP-dependent enzyme